MVVFTATVGLSLVNFESSLKKSSGLDLPGGVVHPFDRGNWKGDMNNYLKLSFHFTFFQFSSFSFSCHVRSFHQ